MADHTDFLFTRRSASDDKDFNYEVHAYHFQLHMKIAECARCRPLAKMIEQTHLLVFNWVCDIAAERPPLPPRSHRSLADVLAGNDPEKSEAAMRAHLREAVDRVIHRLDSPEVIADKLK